MALALAVLQDARDWSAAGHGERWYERLPDAGHALAWFALGIALLLLLLSIAKRRRYHAVGVISESELGSLRAAITEAESKSRGEIVAVVLERSDRHPAADWIAGLAFLLIGSAALAGWIPWDRPALVLPIQIGLGALGFLACRLVPDFKRRFVSELRASEMAEEQAVQEFFREGLYRTEEATGVLLFVSLFEHRVVVLGDSGIDARVGAEHWRATSEAVLAGVRRGSLLDGLREGIRSTGAVLAQHFPRDGEDRDELADRVVVRRE